MVRLLVNELDVMHVVDRTRHWRSECGIVNDEARQMSEYQESLVDELRCCTSPTVIPRPNPENHAVYIHRSTPLRLIFFPVW